MFIKFSQYSFLFLITACTNVGLDYTKIAEDELEIDEGSSSEPSDESNEESSDTSGGTTSGGSTSGGNTSGGSTSGGNPGSTTGGTSGGQPSSTIVSSYWEGDLTRSSGTYYGQESYDMNNGAYPVNQFNCQLVWDLVAQDDTSSNCTGCTFQVKVDATPQSGSHIVNDGTCTNDFVSNTFGYGLTSSYPGYEGSVIMMYAGSTVDNQGTVILNDFTGWFIHEPTQTGPYMNTASYDSNNDVFTYTQGYLDYEYFYQ